MPLPVIALPALGAFLVAMAKPILQQLLRLIGFGLVAYVGFDLAFQELEDYVMQHYQGFPVVALQIMTLAGVDSALQNIFATVTGLVAWKSLTTVVNPTWLKPGTTTIIKDF